MGLVNKMYDVCIIGGGPAGVSLLNEHNKINRKSIIIEEYRPFNTYKSFLNNMIWHSKWKLCKLEDNEFEGVNQNSHPTIEELIQKYDNFIIEKKLSDKIIIDKILEIKIGDKQELQLIGNKNTYICKKCIVATGYCNSPRKFIPLINSENVFRYIKNWEEIENKNVVCIGGGFSSYDLAVKLQNKNDDITILTRNKAKVYNAFRDQIKRWGQKDIDHKKIKVIQYKNQVDKIEDNIIYYNNGEKLIFEICVIMIGHDESNNNLIFPKHKNILVIHSISTEHLYGKTLSNGKKNTFSIKKYVC